MGRRIPPNAPPEYYLDLDKTDHHQYMESRLVFLTDQLHDARMEVKRLTDRRNEVMRECFRLGTTRKHCSTLGKVTRQMVDNLVKDIKEARKATSTKGVS